MLAVQTDVFAVPLRKATILTIRETGGSFRTFTFSNRKRAKLRISIEHSTDSRNWSLVQSPFTVGPVGSNTATVVKDTESPHFLRICASGGGNSEDLDLTYARVKKIADGIWS